MNKIIECVPNFSEGKNEAIINQIYESAKSFKSVKVFELEYNKDHNRMLFTIVGEPEAVLSSVFSAIKKATELIDMNKHVGEHPRIGATDVVPFVPVSGVTMEECVELSNKLAKKVADELKIPVFMYEASAIHEEYRNLADIRVGQFEGLKSAQGGSTLGGNKPDYGPDKIHPTAGAIVIGARKYLVAYNVNLDTKDINIAKQIAKKIREKDGGLPKVKALGFMVDGYAQVSMNLVDFEVTNFDEVYRAIEKEAEILGKVTGRAVKIKNSEIYGMIPMESLVKAIRTSFKADNFTADQILEKKLYE